jgi:hypothetical protein
LQKHGLDKYVTQGLGKYAYTFASEGSEEVLADLASPVIKAAFDIGDSRDKYFGSNWKQGWAEIRKGLFKTTVTDNYEHAIKPQNSGNHFGTEYVEISSRDGRGITVYSERDFEFNALHYSELQLTNTTHDVDLVPSEKTYFEVNYRCSGIGSASCGPDLAEEYKVSEKEFTLTQQKIGRSGISFDFMRYLNDLVKDGVFVEKQDELRWNNIHRWT